MKIQSVFYKLDYYANFYYDYIKILHLFIRQKESKNVEIKIYLFNILVHSF